VKEDRDHRKLLSAQKWRRIRAGYLLNAAAGLDMGGNPGGPSRTGLAFRAANQNASEGRQFHVRANELLRA